MSSSPKYVEKPLDFAVQSPKEHRKNLCGREDWTLSGWSLDGIGLG